MRAAIVFLLLCASACAASPTTGKPKSNGTNTDDTSTGSGDDSSSSDDELNSENDETPTGTFNVTWNALPAGFLYSLDVQTSDDEWIGPCLDNTILGSTTSVVFDGICKSSDNRAVASPKAFRLYYANSNGYWGPGNFVETMASGNAVTFALPTGPAAKVPVSWPSRSANSKYSLDVTLAGGEHIAPCVSVDTLGTSISYEFTGTCTAASNRTVDIGQIIDFTVCSTETTWDKAKCAGVPFNGLGTAAVIPE